MYLFLIILALVIVVVVLIVYNMSIHKKIQTFNNINQKIINLNVLQDFMDTLGEYTAVNQKIKRINDILIEKYEIKYSTIVVFDGTEYKVRASNVDERHWDALKKLQEVEIFKDSIATATPKYITVNNDQERLPYQQMEFGRAKSAVFFPLYFENVYIGYWIIESGTPHDFDNVDTTILEVIKDNIVSILKTVVHQQTMEALTRKDQFSGLYSEEYLYGEGKKIINQYTTSTICMYKIANLEQINKKYSRELGNKIIVDTTNYINRSISNEYLYVRYMGPKFVIVFSGAEKESVLEFLNDVKKHVEALIISLDFETDFSGDAIIPEDAEYASPKLNIYTSTYYKGTGLEEVLKKLEQFIDESKMEGIDIIKSV